jgi:hypothetical protein
MKILKLRTLDELKEKRHEIMRTIEMSGTILIRGLFNRDEVRGSIPLIYSRVDNSKILGTTQASKETVRQNSQKWSIGGFSGAQIGCARFMLTVYNPLACDNQYSFHDKFKRIIDVRDAIRNDGRSTHDVSLESPSFNACRFQIYPSGGGFMLGHRDSEAESTSILNKVPLLQLLLFVTERGIDFKKGGAFIENESGEVDVEAFAQSGDLAIYDGNSFHGVKDIDPEFPLDRAQIRGRIVALVTMYK